MVEVVKGKGAYSKAFIEDLESNGIYYHRSPFSTNFILGALLFPFWFWKLHLKYHPDVYHSHTESPDVALYLFFLLSDRHILAVETDMPYSDALKVVALSDKIRI